jgi:hypothetical protein
MRRREHKGASRPRRREAQRMVDDSALRLVPPGQAGKIGRPAASADVQVDGRTRLERRLQVAPAQACQLPPRAREPAELVRRQASRSTSSAWWSLPCST